MGKRRIIAETGAGQHGVATATCARCWAVRAMSTGAEEWSAVAQSLPHQLLGANVRRVDAGRATLKDAINEAMRDWVATVADAIPLGSVLGPIRIADGARVPFVIGGGACAVPPRDRPPPDVVIACIGGGSNAMGFRRVRGRRAVR